MSNNLKNEEAKLLDDKAREYFRRFMQGRPIGGDKQLKAIRQYFALDEYNFEILKEVIEELKVQRRGES